MNGSVWLEQRKAVPVIIGDVQIYCDSFSVSDSRVLAERATASGDNAVTNQYVKLPRVILKGRTFDEDTPLGAVCSLNGLMGSAQTFNVFYRGITCRNCVVTAYTADDSGRDYIDFSLTLAVESFERIEE